MIALVGDIVSANLPLFVAVVGCIAALLCFSFGVRARWIALCLGVANAAAYLLFVHGARLAFFGLRGDETFVASFLMHVAAGHPFSDFSYAALPPFYPPLYFWIVGGIGWVLHWNGIQAMKLGVALTFALLPVCSVALQEWLWRTRPDAERPSVWGMVIAAVAFFPIVGWDAAILKPYETIAALLGVQLATFFFADAARALTRKQVLFYGLGFGLLLLTYYFWGIQIAVGGLLSFALFSDGRWTRLKNACRVACIALLVATPYWLPYALSLRAGFSPDQGTFLFQDDFLFWAPFLQPTLVGAFLFFGVFSLIIQRRSPVFRALGALALAPYLWQLCGTVLFLLDRRPLLPGKAFLFFGSAVLVTAAGWGIGILLRRHATRAHRLPLFVMGVCATCAFSFGAFTMRPTVRALVPGMQQPTAEVTELTLFFCAHPALLSRTYLSSGVNQLSAFVPLDLFIEPTIHFSHPGARWHERYTFLQSLAESQNAATFAERLLHTPWGAVDGLLLYRHDDAYLLFFQGDAWPNGTREQVISLPVRLVDAVYWDTQTQVGDFLVATRKQY